MKFNLCSLKGLLISHLLYQMRDDLYALITPDQTSHDIGCFKISSPNPEFSDGRLVIEIFVRSCGEIWRDSSRGDLHSFPKADFELVSHDAIYVCWELFSFLVIEQATLHYLLLVLVFLERLLLVWHKVRSDPFIQHHFGVPFDALKIYRELVLSKCAGHNMWSCFGCVSIGLRYLQLSNHRFDDDYSSCREFYQLLSGH